MKKLIVTLILMSLTGCANLKFQASASYMNDNMKEEVAARLAQP